MMFSVPNRLVELPDDLDFSDYLIMPYPQGKRCIVSTHSDKYCVARDKSGLIFKKFYSSALVGGSTISERGSCILDCIYIHSFEIFLVLDII